MSPDRASHAPRAGVVLASIAGCAVMAAAAWVSPLALALAVMVLGTLLALGWVSALGLPCSGGCRWTLVVGALLCGFAALADGMGQWPRWLPAAVATTLLLHFVQQIMRKDGRPRLTETMAMSCFAIALVACGAALVPVGATASGPELVTVALAGAAAGSVADLLGRWRAVRLWLLPLGMVLAAVAAVLAGRELGLATGPAALLGTCAAILGHPVRWLLAQAPQASSLGGRTVIGIAGALAAGALPLVAAQLVILR